MKVFVFGSTGFLGKHVVEKFKQENVEVLDISHEVLDISQPITFEGMVEGDVAINCAAKVILRENINLQELHSVNVNGAINVAIWAKKHNLKLIHCSTLAVYLKPWPVPLRESNPLISLDLSVDPTGGYATSKLLSEIGVNWIKDDAIILRFSALYGPGMKWEGVLPKFIDLARDDGVLEVTGNQYMDFLHVKDAANAIYKIATTPNTARIINVASGCETSILDLATMIVDLSDKHGKIAVKESDIINRACVDVTEMKKETITFTSLRSGLLELSDQALKR